MDIVTRWRRRSPAPSEPAAPLEPFPDFATTDEEAKRRFAETRGQDPFPEIAPALLNTADLLDYIAVTGMVHPFSPDLTDKSRTLKPASCGIPLGGIALWWESKPDGSVQRQEREVRPGEKLLLKRNSIVYVTLEPELRMPDYIAARFNLTIRDIYRGILVGTGPLVDPGFTGRLSVPLHNLTYNDYELVGGEPIVWMEFTKLSPNRAWAGGASATRRGHYVKFPDRKNRLRGVQAYVNRASSEPITSSIPHLVGNAQAAARNAEQTARRLFNVSVAAGVAVVLGIAAIVFAGFELVDGVDSRQRELTRQVDKLQHELSVLRRDASRR